MPAVWGESINANVLHTPNQTEPSPASELADVSGQDSASVCLDSMFTNPAESNYIPTNPLIKGFENFPTEFGVRYAPLRAIADTPVLPVVRKAEQAEESVKKTFGDITVKNIENDGEMSVYGTAGYRGAIVWTVKKNSDAEKRGILAHDVIVGWGDDEIDSIDDLEDKTFSADVPIIVLRGQVRTIL